MNKFYLNTIETLVFSKENVPDTKLVVSILRVITKCSVFGEYGVRLHIKPIYQDLIIQILFQNYCDIVNKQLDSWFKTNSGSDASRSLALSFQKCVQDSLFTTIASYEADMNKKVVYAISISDELKQKLQLLEEAFDKKAKTYSVKCLIILAKFKFCLKILASLANSTDSIDSIDKKLFVQFNNQMKMVMLPTLSYYESDKLFNFLIKEIIRKYGNSSIKFIMAQEDLKWMIPTELTGDNLVILNFINQIR